MCTIVPIVVRYFYCCSITDREDSVENQSLTMPNLINLI